ncbi:nickel pincer cofactor biosynthesis protein LarB [Neorhodopirellula lusitana]|uniref:nickel pincer cofactor biosynthesis protein LarB n=1 Tax=Neorhodopirellula lusitana TaxID=445327 RepID=UPI00384BFC68
MNELDPTLMKILGDLAQGEVSIEATAKKIAQSTAVAGGTDGGAVGAITAGVLPSDDAAAGLSRLAKVDGAVVDLGRLARCGFGEVIYGEGKSTELIQRIAQAQLDAGQDCLITRIEPTAAAQVRRHFEFTHHHPSARTMRIGRTAESLDVLPVDGAKPHVAVVTAGSTDAAVAEEAAETLAWMKVPCRRFEDIGVAGPQRLLSAVPELRQAAAVVVIAGMEGALPAAVAGHIPSMVIAVPTSTGYGANLSGLTPLMGMLSSCAANVAVVNIDAGFKGGYLAGLIVSGLIAAKTE